MKRGRWAVKKTTCFGGCSWSVYPRFAAFALDLLPNVRFAENSWRGDNHCLALSGFLETQ